MLLIARRYLLVLWAILARPWTWLVLAIALTPVGWALANLKSAGFRHRCDVVPLVASPPYQIAESLRALAHKGQLDTVTDFNMGAFDASEIEGGFALGPHDRLEVNPIDATGHQGDWKILDQLPGLKRLWLPAVKSLTAEGWQRIGQHPSLELLSMSLSSFAGGVPEAARAALIQLPRLRYLDLFLAGGEHDFLVPPLPALETIAIDQRSLEVNLRTLANGSPRLATISLEPPWDFKLSRGMLESLKRMPNLKRLYIRSISVTRSDAGRRELARLRAELPGVSVLPGVFSGACVLTAVFAAPLLAAVPFAFWFQAAILLGTPLGWTLPGRLAPHLFWPLAVSSVCGGLFVAVAPSLGIAATPAITLAVFSTLAIPTIGRADVGVVADRISTAALALVISIAVAAWATLMQAPWVLDRWLSGDMPLQAGAILLLVTAISVWQVARYARLPRIYARQGLVNPPGLLCGPALCQQQPGSPAKASSRPFFSWLAKENAEGSPDRHPQLPAANNSAHGLLRLLTGYGSIDDEIDQQIGRPVPAPFADMLRRPRSRRIAVTSALYSGGIFSGIMLLLGLPIPPGQGAWGQGEEFWGPLKLFDYMALYASFVVTVGLWIQRRDSLRLEFLRPVSRHDYWRGLRQAIARDLWFPAGLGAALLALSVALRETDKLEPAIKAVALFCGWFAGTHAILLHAAVTRRPQIVATLALILLLIAVAASLFAMGGLGPYRTDPQIEFLIASAVLVIGFTIRSAVLYRLEDREIG
ncbi:MAG: hypothetical protein WCJ21_07285 [Planctomycetota bacterium]